MANIRTVNWCHLHTVSQKLFCLCHVNLYVLIIIIIIIVIHYYSKNMWTKTRWSMAMKRLSKTSPISAAFIFMSLSLTEKRPQTAFSNDHTHLLAPSLQSDDGQNFYNNIRCYQWTSVTPSQL